MYELSVVVVIVSVLGATYMITQLRFKREASEIQALLEQFREEYDQRTILFETETLAQLQTSPQQTPFVTFPCVCGKMLELLETLEPGQAAVMNCENCETSYSILLPPLKILPTERFEPVWPFTKNAAVNA